MLSEGGSKGQLEADPALQPERSGATGEIGAGSRWGRKLNIDIAIY